MRWKVWSWEKLKSGLNESPLGFPAAQGSWGFLHHQFLWFLRLSLSHIPSLCVCVPACILGLYHREHRGVCARAFWVCTVGNTGVCARMRVCAHACVYTHKDLYLISYVVVVHSLSYD